MKILHVVPTYLPAVRYGGPIFSVHALCRALAEGGDEVEVYTTNVDGPGTLDVPIGERQVLDGVGVTYFPVTSPRRLYRSPALGSALAEGVRTFDLVHLHSTFLWPTQRAARAAESAGVLFVLSPRGMLCPELIEERGRRRKRAWIRLFEQRTWERAAFLHATSGLEERDLRRLGVRTPIEVVPNGVDLPATHVVESRSDPARPLELLFLGRLSWKKGLADLIDALRGLPPCRLVLAGPDDEGLREALEARAREHGVASRLRFAGCVQGDAKERLLRSADALVLPSHGENFGNVVLEALAAGTPVLCTDRVGACDVVSEARAGLVTNTGPASLHEGLQRLLALSPFERRAMGGRGREAMRRFTWRSVATRLRTAYERARTVSPIETAA